MDILLSYQNKPHTIIESVDSNVGIARTRNIWQYRIYANTTQNPI